MRARACSAGEGAGAGAVGWGRGGKRWGGAGAKIKPDETDAAAEASAVVSGAADVPPGGHRPLSGGGGGGTWRAVAARRGHVARARELRWGSAGGPTVTRSGFQFCLLASGI